MDQQALKWRVVQAALQHIEEGIVLGLGSGSTVLCFIEALKESGRRFKRIVSSGEETTRALQAAGYEVSDFYALAAMDVYVDSASEIDPQKCLIKGGGDGLMEEKLFAAMAGTFLCIADSSKKVDVLGGVPVAVEAVPMARHYVARELIKLGGEPRWREGVVTTNGNEILDVDSLDIHDPSALEQTLNSIAGVVTTGIFARECADRVVMIDPDGEITVW